MSKFKMTEEDLKAAAGAYDGYCVRCNDITRFGCTEPDAEGYHCDECDGDTVMGIENAVICGYITIGGPANAGPVD